MYLLAPRGGRENGEIMNYEQYVAARIAAKRVQA